MHLPSLHRGRGCFGPTPEMPGPGRMRGEEFPPL